MKKQRKKQHNPNLPTLQYTYCRSYWLPSGSAYYTIKYIDANTCNILYNFIDLISVPLAKAIPERYSWINPLEVRQKAIKGITDRELSCYKSYNYSQATIERITKNNSGLYGKAIEKTILKDMKKVGLINLEYRYKKEKKECEQIPLKIDSNQK